MESGHRSWDNIEKEKLQPGLFRKVIHGTNITIAQISIDKGIVVPSHKHHNEQISSVMKGSIRVKTDTGEYTLNQGELLVIPPNVPHKVTALEDTMVLDTFSPAREDWEKGDDSYLR